MMNRLFITLDIPSTVLSEISSLVSDMYSAEDAKWEDENKLHITLKFLGDTDTDKINDIVAVLENISARHNSIKTSFEKFGLFYKKGQPKIFWIGLRENPELIQLHAEVEESLSELGFKKEDRRFSPHLTLLRIKGREDISLLKKMKNTTIEPIKFTASQISLMKSELKPSGSVYSTIKSFELS